MAALAPKISEPLPDYEPIQADGGASSVDDPGSEGERSETSRAASLLLTKAGRGHRAAPAQRASSHHPVRDTFTQELDRGIQKLSERRYEIKRSTLELALGNLGLLARTVRVTPEVRDGKPRGFRVFALMADGPIAKLGLRNNDVLVSINGFDLATPDQVLDAYSKFKTAPRLVLGLLRESDEITQEYAIR